MISIRLFLQVSIIAYLYSCSMAENNECDTDSILNLVKSGEVEKVETCYNSGADILITDKKGTPVYRLAIESGQHEMAKNLQRLLMADWQKNGKLITTEKFYQAIEYDYVIMMELFIRRGIDIHAKDEDGVVPAVYAIFNNSNHALSLLLKSNVDVGYEFDFRPLICIATMFNQQRTVEVLLEFGANVNDKDGSDVTPLMFAARDGLVELASFLLAKGADKSLKDVAGDKALDMAMKTNNSAMIDLLRELP